MSGTLNPYKADLVYKDFNELKTIVQKSLPSDDKLKNTMICSSLLKAYDEGKKCCGLGEEEKAYIFLMRFVDSSMKLKSLFKSDKKNRDYVESMISNQTLKSGIEMLEKLQTSLTARYTERSTAQVKSVLAQVKIDDSADTKIVLTPPSSKETDAADKKPKASKQFIGPVEFVRLVEGSLTSTHPKRFLIIDIRPQDEFENSHIDLSLYLSKFKQSTTELVIINVPDELIEPVSWKIENNLEAYFKDPENSSSVQAFKTRTSFDQLILIDQSSQAKDLATNSRMAVFKRALYDYGADKVLKAEPIILDGGWDQWVDYYPGCCKRSASLRKSLQEASPKPEAKKNENMYPSADLLSQRMEAIRSKPADQPTTVPKPAPSQALPNGTSKEVISKPEEKPATPAPKVDPPKPSPVPLVDRSKKPDFSNKTIRAEETSEPEPPKPAEIRPASVNLSDNVQKPELKKSPSEESDKAVPDKPESKQSHNVAAENAESDRESASAKLQEAKPDSNDQRDQPSQKPPAASIPRSSDNVNYVPVGQPINSNSNVPRAFKFEFNRVNNNIVDSVYKPSGYLTLNNRENNLTKVLDSKTGLFTYVEQPSRALQAGSSVPNQQAKTTPTAVPASRPPLDPVLRNAESKPSYKTSLNDTSERKPSSKFESSNLKRTISTPNIAGLVDDDESSSVKAPTASNDLAKNVNKTPVTFEMPSVDRNRKPHVALQQASETNLNSLLHQLNSNKSAVSAMNIEELHPVYSKDVQPGLTGLRNLGNTCFMNSIIQCLSNTRLLLEYFITNAYAKDLNRSNKLGFGGEIADEFAVVVQSMWRGYFKTISPRRFKYLIGQFNEQFITNDQQDSQELLLFLLDGLHEDLNKATRKPLPIKPEELDNMADLDASVASWKIHLSMNNSIIVDLFQGQFKSTVSCLTCGKVSVKFDAFMYLTLPILPSRCTIFDCVELFLQPEKMSGESKWKCPKCNQLREAVKKIDLWKLPQLLIVHLKRFKYHGVWRDKLTTFVDYPLENLDMDKYLVKYSPFANANNPKPLNKYYLYGISNHSGTMDGGHYTSMCRHPTFNSWFKYDDSDVSPIGDASSLKSSTSYILFYSRY